MEAARLTPAEDTSHPVCAPSSVPQASAGNQRHKLPDASSPAYVIAWFLCRSRPCAQTPCWPQQPPGCRWPGVSHSALCPAHKAAGRRPLGMEPALALSLLRETRGMTSRKDPRNHGDLSHHDHLEARRDRRAPAFPLHRRPPLFHQRHGSQLPSSTSRPHPRPREGLTQAHGSPPPAAADTARGPQRGTQHRPALT